MVEFSKYKNGYNSVSNTDITPTLNVVVAERYPRHILKALNKYVECPFTLWGGVFEFWSKQLELPDFSTQNDIQLKLWLERQCFKQC